MLAAAQTKHMLSIRSPQPLSNLLAPLDLGFTTPQKIIIAPWAPMHTGLKGRSRDTSWRRTAERCAGIGVSDCHGRLPDIVSWLSPFWFAFINVHRGR
jgi:hypothetical protein